MRSSLKPFLSLTLSLSLIAPTLASAQSVNYVTKTDIQQVNAELADKPDFCLDPSTYYQEDADKRALNQAWRDGLAIHNNPVNGYFNRYPVLFGSKRVNIAIPYSSDWSLRGKKLQPYLQINNAGVGVGPVEIVNNSVQDTSCFAAREYTITLEKGSIAKKEAELRKEIKNWEGNVEDLPTMTMQMNGKQVAIIPVTIDNSGGLSLRYQRVLVNISGGYVLTIRRGGGYDESVNPTMIRMAASAQ